MHVLHGTCWYPPISVVLRFRAFSQSLRMFPYRFCSQSPHIQLFSSHISHILTLSLVPHSVVPPLSNISLFFSLVPHLVAPLRRRCPFIPSWRNQFAAGQLFPREITTNYTRGNGRPPFLFSRRGNRWAHVTTTNKQSAETEKEAHERKKKEVTPASHGKHP